MSENNIKIIGIANDHAGYELKTKVVEYLSENNYEVRDYGAFSSESVDYPDYAHILADAILGGECDTGIAICCTGNGINMTANKYSEIRSALCWHPEISRLSRAHNNANVCALPAHFISDDTAYSILDAFLNTPFDNGRHERRVQKISKKPKVYSK